MPTTRQRMIVRTAADALMGLALFLAFTCLIGTYERASAATQRLGGILAITSSADHLLKFPLDDRPLLTAAVVATAVPMPDPEAVVQAHPRQETAFALLAVIFSALVALNLAFFRHLRREYASPR